MNIQLIRNATMRIAYAGQMILTDPCLAAPGDLPAYGGRSRNPTVSLPIAIEQVLAQIDLETNPSLWMRSRRWLSAASHRRVRSSLFTWRHLTTAP